MIPPVPPNWLPAPDATANGNGHLPEIEWLHGFDMREVEFVENPLLQAGTFHLLGGRPGVGKGALSARWVARCTNGQMYGDPRVALWLSSEDDPGYDLGPRVEAAGGNRQLCGVVSSNFTLPGDIGWMRSTIEGIGNVGIVIIDPLSNHTGTAKGNDEEDVRQALMPLGLMAAELNVPVIGIRHISTKEKPGEALTRILGATAWIGVPRAVLVAAKDPAGSLHVHPVKGNRSKTNGNGVKYAFTGVLLPGFKEDIVTLVEEGQSRMDIDALLSARSDTKSAHARSALLEILGATDEGEMESDHLDAAVAAMTGLAAKTIRNLRTDMKNDGLIRARPEKDDDGQILHWVVCLTNAGRDEDPGPDPDLARARVRDIIGGSSVCGDMQGFSNEAPANAQTPHIPTFTSGPEPQNLANLPTNLPQATATSQCPICESYDINQSTGTCRRCGTRVV